MYTTIVRFFVTLTVFLGLAAPVTAQDDPAGAADGPRDDAFVIREIRFDIEGRTRQWVLRDKLDLTVGMTFPDEESLISHIARQEQLLINERALQEATVRAEYRMPDPADPTPEEPIPVTVQVHTEDTWNIIVLPYARYDSNTGLLLSLRGRDYNFFGTLTELAVNFDYEKTENLEDLFTISSRFSIPFRLLEQRWRVFMEQDLELSGDTVDFGIDLGLGYEFEAFGLGWEAAYTQSFNYLTNDPLGDTAYYTSRVSLDSSIGTFLRLPGFGYFLWNPGIYGERSYRPGGISEERRGTAVGFDQSLTAGDRDWIGNYRRGQTIELGNDNRYNIDEEKWDAEITAEVAVFRPLWQRSPEAWPKAGVSAAASGFYLIDGAGENQDDAAAAARGILNDRMNGDLGLFLNLDAVVTFWTLEPIFEAQIGVFFDTAYVRDLRGTFGSTAYDAERDLRFGGGIEVIGFPLFARSLYVRGSLGSDIRAVLDGASPISSEAREIFIGLGHHY